MCLLAGGVGFTDSASSDSVSATTPKAAETALETVRFADEKLVNAYYQMDSAINNQPTVVSDGVDESTIAAAVSGEEKPSNIILRFNGEGNITDKNGNEFGSFESVHRTYLQNKCIPVLRIESAEAADAFLALTENFALLDMSVMSSDAAVLKKIRTAAKWVRGILRFEELTDVAQAVATANAHYATTILLEQKDATAENVNYIQARFKSVWVNVESYLASDIYYAVNSGAYGVVSTYCQDVYDVLSTYSGNSVTRTPYNVAHRGCPGVTNENSLSGVKLAVESGATHLELDGYLTSDNEIVMMHDTDISRTSNGTGHVENFTLNQLKEFDLDLYEPYEKIPSLQEVLEEIKDTDIVLVFEIKSSKTAIVDRFKEVIEEYGMASQCVAITFGTTMLGAMRDVLPEVPTAYLENSAVVNVNTLPELLQTLGEYNAVVDKNYQKGTTSSFDRYLKDRGYAGWYWTFNDEKAVDAGKDSGFVGLTNNVAETWKNDARFVTGKTASSFAVGSEAEITLPTYSGEEKTVTGEIFYSRKTLGGYYLVSRYLFEERYLYTQTYFVSA